MPKAVICLLSALSYHGLTTELPGKVWIALPAKARVSNLDYPEVEVVYLKEPRKFGEQIVTIDKVPVSKSHPFVRDFLTLPINLRKFFQATSLLPHCGNN